MSLIKLWEKQQNHIQSKSIEQIIKFAGDGKLLDGNNTSSELREFFSIAPSKLLFKFSAQCLESKFEDNGLALQDIVNEIGKRLGFIVSPGRYRGKKNEIGFDGLWRTQLSEAIVVEIKTSSTYSMDLEIVGKYKRQLIQRENLIPEKTSILLIVGKMETAAWEAQIRGSRHAWDTRIISVESLSRLLFIKENLDDPTILGKIKEILIPKEYTKVDGIIDLVFSTAEDIKWEHVDEISSGHDSPQNSGSKQPKFTPVSFHQECIDKVEKKLNKKLVKESRTTYATPNNDTLVVCLVSKKYEKASSCLYWYAFHPHQRDRLKENQDGYLVLGCGSSDLILLISIEEFLPWLEKMNITEKEDRFYWHVQIQEGEDGVRLNTKKDYEPVSLSKYVL